MQPTAHLLNHLHSLVYEQTGWALPDMMLRDVAHRVPANIQAQADSPHARLLVRRWVRQARPEILGVIAQMQQGDVMYA